MDGSEDIEVGGRADIALVRREAEHRDRQLLVCTGLDSQRRPADGTFSDCIHPVLQGVSLTGGIVAAGENDWLDRSIQLGNGDLQGNLNRMQTEVAVLPLLGGLKHQRQGNHVRTVEFFEGLNRLGMVLAGWTTHQSESC